MATPTEVDVASSEAGAFSEHGGEGSVECSMEAFRIRSESMWDSGCCKEDQLSHLSELASVVAPKLVCADPDAYVGDCLDFMDLSPLETLLRDKVEVATQFDLRDPVFGALDQGTCHQSGARGELQRPWEALQRPARFSRKVG